MQLGTVCVSPQWNVHVLLLVYKELQSPAIRETSPPREMSEHYKWTHLKCVPRGVLLCHSTY